MPSLDPLELDIEHLHEMADVYAGYSRVLLDGDQADMQPWAASARLLAAVYRSLIAPASAATEFAAAARLYADAEAPFGVVLSVCGQNVDLVEHYLARMGERQARLRDPDEQFATMVAMAWSGREEQSPPIDDSEPPRAGVGRLRVPLGSYVRALRAMMAATEADRAARVAGREGPGRAAVATAALLERAAEPIAGAMVDRFHWRMLHSAVLPLEPEVLAMCLGLLRYWRATGQDARVLLERVTEAGAAALATIPLAVAIEMTEEEPEDEPAAVGEPVPLEGPGLARAY